MGAINAFNMLDGMDGLAGTMAFIALLALAILGTSIGDGSITSTSLVVCGAVTAFLIFNIPAKFNRRFRCFMGDAGSTLLGFLLACMCISISQGDAGGTVSPTTTLWLVAIPLFELLWTTLRRLLRGRSPFHPDRAHFHHKLLDAGFGVRGAFLVLVCIGSFFALAGIAIEVLDISDSVSFAVWLCAGAGLGVLMNNAQVLWFILPRALRRVRGSPA
jgi:UDP-GlcNAc:undecaprenyl-phosphate GlcNAc-1-phosphate transferase